MSKRSLCFGIIACALLCSNPLSAQESDALENRLSAQVLYTADIFANATGGVDTGVRFMDNLDVLVKGEWDFVTLFLYGLANQGGNLSELTGDLQTASNIEAPNSFRLYEAWANFPIKPLKSSLLIGLYDLNSEFDITNTGSLFINSSHGIGAEFASSGRFGPSIFPYTSLAARLKVNLIPGISLKGAVFDGIPSDPADPSGTKVRLRSSDGSLMVGEIELFSPKSTASTGRNVVTSSPFRIILGIWKYSEERIGWDGELQLDAGVYAMVEARVFKENGEDKQGLSLFARYGLTNKQVSRYEGYVGAGVVYDGIFPDRDADKMGIAFSLPMNSEAYLEAKNQELADELITEFTYQIAISSAFKVQLDAQYIKNPNKAPGIDDALVVGIRTIIGF